MLTFDAHPSLHAATFVTRFPAPLGELNPLPAAQALKQQLSLSAAAPVESSDAVRAAVRDLLRYGGYKPTGRGKPASEYLLRAAGEGSLGSINAAVDACNVASLHSGLPISVIDLKLAQAPFRIALAPPGTSYVFNASGQEIDVSGLLCLFDAAGACANAVKDAQRTKTRPHTVETLSVVWGSNALGAHVNRTSDWYRTLLQGLGATTELIGSSLGESHRTAESASMATANGCGYFSSSDR